MRFVTLSTIANLRMAAIEFHHVDETWIKIVADAATYRELKDEFSFYTPNYRFHPKFKAGYWDGRISLIDWKSKQIYKGLLMKLIEFCEEETRNLSYWIDPLILESMPTFELQDDKIIEFYSRIKGPFKPHQSQIDAFKHCVNNGRAVVLAPTSNGKSYMIHGLTEFHGRQKQKILVIIDRSQLIEQLRENLRDEYNGSLRYETVYDQGNLDCDVYFTTWQSCYQNDSKWFKQFDVLIGDEVHKFAADSTKKIIDKCGHIGIRYGFTATLDNDSKINRLTLIGMFGIASEVTTVSELIDAGIVARPTIYAIIREYSQDLKRKIYREHGVEINKKWVMSFPAECEFLEESDERTEFITKLDSALKGNTVIAFKRSRQGKKLVQSIQSLRESKGISTDSLYYIDHKVKNNNRIDYSKDIDVSNDATAVLSLGTSSTGVNIKNINNIIVACQLKSSVTVPQLIGRGLRISDRKTTVDVYDIGDDLTYNGKPNATLNHFKRRLEIYSSLGYKIVIKKFKVT